MGMVGIWKVIIFDARKMRALVRDISDIADIQALAVMLNRTCKQIE